MEQCRPRGYAVADLSLARARNCIKRVGEDFFCATKQRCMKYRVTAFLSGPKEEGTKGTGSLLLMGD